MESETKCARVQILKLEMTSLNKVIDGYEAALKAVKECYSNLEDLNSNLYKISNLPERYEATDKMCTLVGMEYDMHKHISRAKKYLKEVEDEYDALLEEGENETSE